MSKWLTVARQEYGANVRRKGFLASVIGVPLLFIGGFAALFAFIVLGSDPKGIGYVDQSGLLQAQPERVVITDTLLPDVPVIRFTDEAAAQAATRAETIDGYMVVASDYLSSGVLLGYARDSLPDVSKDAFETFFSRSLIERGGSPAPGRLADVVTEVRQRTLLTGREATSGQALLLFFAPYLFGMFFFIAIFSSGSYLMTAVVEEKENRVMEILATSIRPFSLMAGKIVGLGLLGVTQITVWTLTVVGLFSLAQSRIPGMAGLSLPGDVLLIMLLLFVPAYLLVAACFSTVGAAVTAVQEGQQFSGVISLLCVSPVWFLPLIIKQPASLLAVIASIAPFTGPIVMMQRIAVTPVPAWQIGLAVAIQSLAALGMIWVAGRVLRFGMLRYGKRLGLGDLRQALRRREASHEH